MKKLLTLIVFPIIIVVLGYFLVRSIMQPVTFDKEKTRRETVAAEHLKDIRTLQEGYKSKYRRYAATMDSLLLFYHYDTIIVIKQEAIPLSVKDTLLNNKPAGYSIDSLRYIPFSGKDTVIMESVIRPVSGVNIPLFEACMPYKSLLKGLNEQLIINLHHARVETNRYPGMKVGNITTPNNNAGNWE